MKEKSQCGVMLGHQEGLGPAPHCTNAAVGPRERKNACNVFHSTLQTGKITNNDLNFGFAYFIPVTAQFKSFPQSLVLVLRGFTQKCFSKASSYMFKRYFILTH